MSPVQATGGTGDARAPEGISGYSGTTIFDADQCRKGYGINMFCMSLLKAENREAFKKDEAGYIKQFNMTPEQAEAVLKRDWNGMLALGGNIYFTAKLAANRWAFVPAGGGDDDRLNAAAIRGHDAGGRALAEWKPQQIRMGEQEWLRS